MFNLLRKSYSGLSKEVWILALVTLVNRSGMMVLPFMAIYFTSALDFTVAQAGIVASFFGVGSMIGSYYGGYFSDRFGYFGIQLMSLVLGGVACICLVWIKSFMGMCIGMVITSALLDMLRPSMTAAISSFSKPTSVTRSFSLIRMAINLGAGIGPAVAGILAGISFKLIFVGDGITSIAAGFVLYLFFRQRISSKRVAHQPNSAAIHPLSDSMYVLYILFCMCYAIIFFQLFVTLPLYYDQVHHLLKKETGYLIALNGLIVFLFEMMLVFKLENAVHPKKIIIAGILLSGIGLVILNFSGSGIVLIISMIVLSFSEIFAMPFMMTVAVSPAESGNRGVYTGIYATAWSAAFIISPIIGTGIVTHFGFNVLWWSMGLLSLITLVGIYFIIPKVYKVI